MERQRLALAVAALLVVGGLGLAANALDEGTATGGGGGDPSVTTGGASSPVAGGGGGTIVLPLSVLALALVLGLAVLAYREAIPRRPTGILVVVVLVMLALIALSTTFPSADRAGNGTLDGQGASAERDATTPAAGDSAGETSETVPVGPGIALGLLAAAFLAGGLLVWATGPESDPDTAEKQDTSEAVAEAAARGADRLASDVAVSNAVYRTWQEMTDALDVADPETSTPAAFERAAVDAGLDREDVHTLTELFREVRYGDAEVTAERERDAEAALRRIEARAAERDDSTGDGTDDGTGDATGDSERGERA